MKTFNFNQWSQHHLALIEQALEDGVVLGVLELERYFDQR